MKKISRFLLLLMIPGIIILAKPQAELPITVTGNIIPFELKDFLILVKCQINDSKEIYPFVLDTGARTFIDKTLADQLNLKQQGPMAKISNLVMAGQTFGNVFVFTNFNMHQFKQAYGLQVHGIIGSDFLERFTVTLDYEKQMMILSTQPQSLAAIQEKDKSAYLLKFTKHAINHAPMIACKLDGHIETQSMIDTGQPFALVLPLNFLEKMGTLKSEGIRKAKGTIVKWPGTTSPDNYLTRTKSLAADGLKTENLETVYAELPDSLSVPLLGADFLSQFIITINYPQNEILLQPKTGDPRKDHLFSTGLKLAENDLQEVVVRGIWEQSPADRAGIMVGDCVLEFNSIKLTPETLGQLWLLLSDEKIKQVDLLLKNMTGQRKVTLKKDNLIGPT